MKRHFSLCMFVINMLLGCAAYGCPCGFSPEDKRPFFEQYEVPNTSQTPTSTDEKEK